MKLRALLAALLISVAAFSQDRPQHIGVIDFYGYAGLDLEKIRAAIPVHEGDDFSASPDAIATLIERTGEAVKSATGRPPMGVAPVCCDSHGDWMLYVGLPGNSVKNLQYNPEPKGTERLPSDIVSLYRLTMDSLMEAVQKGAGEDDSKGYALSADPHLRSKQLAMREYAVKNEPLIRSVLRSSGDPEQRIVAAFALGYTKQSNEQIAALVEAAHDSNDTVRNNAVRALAVLGTSDAKIAGRIPAEEFIEMLSSGSWSDRNKGGYLLDVLTQSRNPQLLNLLRSRALTPLLEMARWRNPGHSYSALILLGRIAGIDEARLKQLIQNGQADSIINAVRTTS
jgi:hypothetical protein